MPTKPPTGKATTKKRVPRWAKPAPPWNRAQRMAPGTVRKRMTLEWKDVVEPKGDLTEAERASIKKQHAAFLAKKKDTAGVGRR